MRLVLTPRILKKTRTGRTWDWCLVRQTLSVALTGYPAQPDLRVRHAFPVEVRRVPLGEPSTCVRLSKIETSLEVRLWVDLEKVVDDFAALKIEFHTLLDGESAPKCFLQYSHALLDGSGYGQRLQQHCHAISRECKFKIRTVLSELGD